MNQEKIGSFIKKLRKDNNMTQAEFANKYGVTYQAVSNWEKGKNLPDISLLKEMSKDFNISIDNLLDGNNKKNNNKLYIILIVLFILIIIMLIILYINNSSYEFKTLSSTCDNFNISGSLSYDNKKTSIFINNVTYCGGDDNTLYKDIECVLYESNNDTETIISSCNYDNNENIKLEDYLKTIEFTVSDYSRTCKKYTDDNLYLRINATDDNNKTITYKIPLTLKDCN